MRIGNEFLPWGRLTRFGFWTRHLLVLPLAIGTCIAAATLAGAPWDLAPVALTLFFLVSVWGRRLHDRGRSAWWLCLVAVPIVGALFLLIECGLRGTPIHNTSAADYKTV